MSIIIGHMANGELYVDSGDLDLKTGRMTQHVNPTPLLCQATVRKFLLEQAARTRAHKYTRVSEQTLIEANEHLRQWLVLRIAKLPSMGKTI